MVNIDKDGNWMPFYLMYKNLREIGRGTSNLELNLLFCPPIKANNNLSFIYFFFFCKNIMNIVFLIIEWLVVPSCGLSLIFFKIYILCVLLLKVDFFY